MSDVLHISADNKLIVTTEDGLTNTIVKILKQMGITDYMTENKEKRAREIPTKLAKKMMEEKGYRVSTQRPFKELMNAHRINAVRRGKDDWYQVDELDKIPNRK